jgi:hypothetical protein
MARLPPKISRILPGSLWRDLGTITKNQIRFVHSPLEITEMLTTPTPLQQRALTLLQVPLKR